MRTANLFSHIGQTFRKNLGPGIVLWVIATLIALAYYQLPAVTAIFSQIGTFKAHYGLWYACCSTAFFGGFIPFLYFVATRQTGKRPWLELLFYLVFWGIKGIEVDLFYRLQGMIFGNAPQIATIVSKTLVDQLLYAPLWAVPSIAVAYLYKDANFQVQTTLQRIDRTFCTFTIPTIIISNALVWCPSVTIIYTMPPDLQIPMFNIVQCFFALLLNMLSKREP